MNKCFIIIVIELKNGSILINKILKLLGLVKCYLKKV